MRIGWCIACAALGVMAMPASAATAKRERAGKLPDGTEIEAVTLTAANGVSARILNYGATLHRLVAPDRDGELADVLLGYEDAAEYAARPNYFGVTVGRYANRIAGGRFTLDGQTYQLPLNNGPNALHGGDGGFDRQLWRILSVSDEAQAKVVMALTSPDGDQGFPGRVEARVTFLLDDDGTLTIEHEATTDKPTIVNMTNHAIFNLSGEGAPGGALAHRLTINAAAYTPVDADLIPTGERRPVVDTVFDFTRPRTLEAGVREGRDDQIVKGRGYDHNFALDKGLTATPEPVARLEDPVSGRVLEVLSTEPGVQLYTTNFLDGTFIGKNGHAYRMGDGIALEPQKFPNAPNQPDFVPARLDPGQTYRHVMTFRMSVAPR